MMLYLQLFWEFFKTGLFAIGGGMATLPFLYDMADKTGWDCGMITSCEYSAFCVYQLIGGLLLWNCLSPFFSSSAV